MALQDANIIRIERHELDLGAGELRRSGVAVDVEPQVFALIAYLAGRPGELISRDNLIEAVWGGRIVSDSAIASRINAARAALGDDGKAQKVIQTVPRRGFRFVGGREASTRALPDKPSIAVLPFDNLSGDPEQAFFSDGITDDTITDLSRYDELFVIARHSSFAYRGGGRDRAGIASDLGVQYVLEGSVRRAGVRVRVTAQLVDVAEGRQLWAERYDREAADVFAVQDEITAVIVNTLVGEVSRRHYRRVACGGADGGSAYDHTLRGMELVRRVSREATGAARAAAMRAVELDPDFARAHAVVAWTHATEGSNRWSDDPDASFAMGLEAARRARGADARDPWGHAVLGFSEIYANRAHERGLAALRRAIELNPSNAQFRFLYGWALAYAGHPEGSERELALALRHDPHCAPLYHSFFGRALFLQRRFGEAAAAMERHLDGVPDHANGLAFAAACYAALDRAEDARAAVARLAELSPEFTVSYTRAAAPYARAEDLALYCSMLERAGVPP